MGPLLVLVSPCFRENVVVTCKIGSFLCSLDNLLQKNVISFFFENQISKWHSIEKRLLLTYFLPFLLGPSKKETTNYLTFVFNNFLFYFKAYIDSFVFIPSLLLICCLFFVCCCFWSLCGVWGVGVCGWVYFPPFCNCIYILS